MMGLSFDSDTLDKCILGFVEAQDRVLTPSDLVREIKIKTGFDRKDIHTRIQILVSTGELEYQDLFGRTCLSISFSRPVHVSTRVVLKPPDIPYTLNSHDVVVSLTKGIAFGRGTHPTTRLSILALTFLYDVLDKNKITVKRSLDVGTGTGVLAIVSALLGSEVVYACDIDSVAINEAEENIRINHLDHKIHISDSMGGWQPSDLLIANLRFPTLISLQPTFMSLLHPKGHLVLSGIKIEEKEKVIDYYEHDSMKLVWEKSHGGWCALVLKSQI